MTSDQDPDCLLRIVYPIVLCKYGTLTLVLLNPDISCFANSVDPDQLASEEAN